MTEAVPDNIENPYFLQGGGEMGEVIRAINWDTTPLGRPQLWPSALKTSVAMMLDNPFGMYIAWGKEYIQMYNNGYRPILGENKHPKALGISTRETFSEIWYIIGSMFDGVMEGKAVGFPNFMLPLNRNGFVEECYFDFSYSPIRLEDGTVGGVLVTVIETTNKKKAEDALIESEQRFRAMADNIPNLGWMADDTGYIYWYNKQWYEYTGTNLEQMKGWGWQTVHDLEMLPLVIANWNKSIETGDSFEMTFPLKGADGTFKQFLTRVLPVRDDTGRIQQWFGTNTDITNQIRAEQDLKESEERFRTMAEGIDIMIATSDENSNATYFNRAWTDLTGRSMEQLINYGWTDLVHEEDRQNFLDIYLHAFEKRENWTGEFRLLDKNGNYKSILAKVPARFRPNGSFVGYISSCMDISERKEAENKIKKSELELRSFIESAPYPIGVYIGQEMIVQVANQTMLDFWGKGNNILGKSYKEILPELGDQDIFGQLDDVFKSGVAFHAKNQRVDFIINGKIHTNYFNYSFTPLFDDQGNVYGVMNTGADVTDLNLAKQKVEQSENSLKETILQAPVAMCILREPNFVVELANDLMCELWGKTQEDVSGKPIFAGLQEAKNQGFEELLTGVYNTGEPFIAAGASINLPRGASIQKVYVNFVYAPYRERDGEISGILVIAVDVTPQVLARQEIEEIVASRTKELALANSNLQESNAELAQFAYIASHDLQEPLRKISTYTQLLEKRIASNIDDQSRIFLDKINNSSSRMNVLIKDVLAYSEISKETELFTDADLNKILENVLIDFELLMEEKNARIQSDQLPVIDAIPLQMSQLFSNLISNALKFSRKDIAPVIIINCSKPNHEEMRFLKPRLNTEYVKISVSDNGIGFKQEQQERIFNIFQRLHRKSEYAGTGIGLAMCKKIALNHQGDLNATGSSEAGAVFNIIIPVQQRL